VRSPRGRFRANHWSPSTPRCVYGLDVFPGEDGHAQERSLLKEDTDTCLCPLDHHDRLPAVLQESAT
jgi:hypothetical protein